MGKTFTRPEALKDQQEDRDRSDVPDGSENGADKNAGSFDHRLDHHSE